MAIPKSRDLLGRPFFNGNGSTIRDRQVDGGQWARHIERDVVALRQHSHHVGPNLVGHIPIGRHAVRADHDRIDFTPAHQVTGHVVGDQRHRDFFLHHLPSRQARALQKWAGLIGNHRNALACLHSRANDTQRRAVPGCRQGARIAMRQNPGAVNQQRCAVSAHGAIDANIVR